MNQYKGVVEIEILGQKRGFKFGMACTAMLCKLEECSLKEVQEKLSTNDQITMCNLYYAAAVQYVRLKNAEQTEKSKEPTFEEVANWIDNMSLEQNEDAVKTAFAHYEDPNKEAPQQTGQS